MIEPFTFTIRKMQIFIEKDNEIEKKLDVSEIYTHKNIWLDRTKFRWINNKICLLYGWPNFYLIKGMNLFHATDVFCLDTIQAVETILLTDLTKFLLIQINFA